jgi:hypothetical protein
MNIKMIYTLTDWYLNRATSRGITMTTCNKCGRPIAFKKLANGKLYPTNPDGSDHWDLCKSTTNKSHTGPKTLFMGRTVDGVLITYANSNPVMKDSANTVREKWEISA